MNIEREYRRLRAKDWPAHEAMRAARVNAQFTEYEEQGLVRFYAEPDECSFIEEHIGDYSDLPEKLRKKYQAEDRELAEREGIWVYLTAIRPNKRTPWKVVDSLGACVGELKDAGYDTDMKEAALEALDNAFEAAAATLTERATFAAG